MIFDRVASQYAYMTLASIILLIAILTSSGRKRGWTLWRGNAKSVALNSDQECQYLPVHLVLMPPSTIISRARSGHTPKTDRSVPASHRWLQAPHDCTIHYNICRVPLMSLLIEPYLGVFQFTLTKSWSAKQVHQNKALSVCMGITSPGVTDTQT
jgi:hypothetical protein